MAFTGWELCLRHQRLHVRQIGVEQFCRASNWDGCLHQNTVTKSKDLIFEFEMFVLPISEAKRLHPELEKLETKIEQGATSWNAAYHLKEDEKQAADGTPR